MNPKTVEHPYIQIAGNSGYSRQGDTVSLFADRIENINNLGVPSGSIALQLWACDAPYYGGILAGWKLGEVQLGTLQPNHYLVSVKSDVQANFPESGDYAIVLVIAEWDGDGFNRVHDFQNYPNRDVFLHPRLEGTVGYRSVDESHMAVNVGQIYNPRDPDNESGTLSLELWALPEPYIGGAFGGQPLAAVMLGSLAGGERWQDCRYDLEVTPPPAGTYTLTLMLREWVGNGYVTRDHSNFQYPVTFPIVPPAPEASEAAAVEDVTGAGHEAALPEPDEAKQVSEGMEVETSGDKVASSAETTGQAGEAALDGGADGAARQAGLARPTATEQASETIAVDTALDEVASAGQAAGPANEAKVVEIVAAAERQAELARARSEKQASETIAVETALDAVVRSGISSGGASKATVVGIVDAAEQKVEISTDNDMKQASETIADDTALEEVVSTGQGAGQASENENVPGTVDIAACESLKSGSEDMKQASTARGSEKTPADGEPDAPKSFERRLSEWFQQLKRWLRF